MDQVATFTQQHIDSKKTTNRRFELDLTEAIVPVLDFKLCKKLFSKQPYY